MTGGLPDGPRGRALAAGVTLAGVALLWPALAAPLLDWHAGRQETLQRQAMLMARMEDLAAALPALRREAAAARAAPGRAAAALEGGSDAVAAAALEQSLDELAAGTGLRIGSAETLPAEPAGAWQAITIRVTVTASWPPLVRLLEAIAAAPTAMVVDNLQLRPPPRSSRDPDWPIDAGFNVTAWRAREGAEP
jgi:general secretion pathway protein M